jgi:uncharacterized membrane protein
MLRLMGVVSPPPGSSPWLRVRGILLLLLAVLAILALGFGLVKLIALPFGGLSTSLSIFWGFVVVLIALAVLVVLGRRRQKRARAQIAERRASQAGR